MREIPFDAARLEYLGVGREQRIDTRQIAALDCLLILRQGRRRRLIIRAGAAWAGTAMTSASPITACLIRLMLILPFGALAASVRRDALIRFLRTVAAANLR